MRIYTRGGDKGETGLFGGGRVPKNHPRVEAYGAVDELNAALGLARSQGGAGDLDGLLDRLQRELFVLGADLATPPATSAREDRVTRLPAGAAAGLEAEIDRCEQELEPLQTFILPGGSACGAALHLARTICRRAERRLVAASASESFSPEAVPYLNRLSDLLFVMARLANARAGRSEPTWTPRS